MAKLQDALDAAIKAFPVEKKFYVKDLIKDPPVGIDVWLKKHKDEIVSVGVDENGEEQFKKIATKK